MIFLDFETRSTVDLTKCGAHVYAAHPSTDIMCMGYAFDDEPVEMWNPSTDPPLDLLLNAETTPIVAHNAAFEIEIWNTVGVKKYGFPPLKPENFICTMAAAYAMALPGSLEKAAAALGIEDGKDVKGHRLMLQLSQPRSLEADGSPVWWEGEDKFKRLYEYCAKDVAVEREVYKRVVPLSEKEREVWFLDQEINQRGITVDVRAVRAAIRLVQAEKTRLDSEMRRVTGNQVATCSAVAQLKDWLKFRGFETAGIAKADVTELLDRTDLPTDIRTVLTLRQEAAKTSTAKLEMLISGLGKDGRIRGLYQYHGANTGRFAGRRFQGHNLPRPMNSQEVIESVFEILGRIAA